MAVPSADYLKELTGLRFQDAGTQRAALEQAAFEVLGESREEALCQLSAQTAVVTLLAGSGSRWVHSIEAFREEWPAGIDEELRNAAVTFCLEKPRGLFPVKNHMDSGDTALIPIAAYSLAAVKGLGSHLIVTGGFEEEIEAQILNPLGFKPGSFEFRRQELFQGKPLGHGAAAWQCRDFWCRKKYVIFNFGGDANNRKTLEVSLLVMAALEKAGEGPGLLLPAALVKQPAYTIETDDQGFPVKFLHQKLTGASAGSEAGYSNVGLRIYESRTLLSLLEELHRNHFSEDQGYRIPGNQSNEMALDNADARLAEQRQVRLLAVADPREITPAKTLWAIPDFLRAVSGLWGAS